MELDIARTRRRVAHAARRWDPHAELVAFEPALRGASSLTFVAGFSTPSAYSLRQVYVKVAPPGLPPVRHRDVLRQAALQRLLADKIPVPTVLFEEADHDLADPPFYGAAAIDGECFEPLIDPGDTRVEPRDLAARAESAVRVLARLRQIDVRHGDLLGVVPVALVDELDHWQGAFSTMASPVPSVAAECYAELRRTLPAQLSATFVHGDYRLGNMICAGGQVHAVIDWETWCITDPRLDLAWLLMTLNATNLPTAIRSSAPGLPGIDGLTKCYESATSAEVTDLAWFAAFCRYRSAATLALIVRNNRKRREPSPRAESYASIVPRYLDCALRLLRDVQPAHDAV